MVDGMNRREGLAGGPNRGLMGVVSKSCWMLVWAVCTRQLMVSIPGLRQRYPAPFPPHSAPPAAYILFKVPRYSDRTRT